MQPLLPTHDHVGREREADEVQDHGDAEDGLEGDCGQHERRTSHKHKIAENAGNERSAKGFAVAIPFIRGGRDDRKIPAPPLRVFGPNNTC